MQEVVYGCIYYGHGVRAAVDHHIMPVDRKTASTRRPHIDRDTMTDSAFLTALELVIGLDADLLDVVGLSLKISLTAVAIAARLAPSGEDRPHPVDDGDHRVVEGARDLV